MKEATSSSTAVVWFAFPAGLMFHFVATPGKQKNVGIGGHELFLGGKSCDASAFLPEWLVGKRSGTIHWNLVAFLSILDRSQDFSGILSTDFPGNI